LVYKKPIYNNNIVYSVCDAAWFVQDDKADNFTSKVLKALNNMKIKIPGRNQADADCIYRQVGREKPD